MPQVSTLCKIETAIRARALAPCRNPKDADHVCAGYMFNIGMLKRVFNPTFELHDIKQTGEYEATTRWWAAAQQFIQLHS